MPPNAANDKRRRECMRGVPPGAQNSASARTYQVEKGEVTGLKPYRGGGDWACPTEIRVDASQPKLLDPVVAEGSFCDRLASCRPSRAWPRAWFLCAQRHRSAPLCRKSPSKNT